jgi:uncharacterized protein
VKLVVLLDSGPLVAFLHRRDKHHDWAVQQFSKLEPPFYTCEPVLTESCFLLRGLRGGSEAVLKLVENGLIRVAVTLTDEITAIRRLMVKYASVPISLADACLVRLSENQSNGVVLTLDADFGTYRKHGRQIIPTIMPKSK